MALGSLGESRACCCCRERERGELRVKIIRKSDLVVVTDPEGPLSHDEVDT